MSQEFTIDVWSDFVCPWCFLAATTLRQLEETHHVTVRWHSFELRPKGSPPIPDWYKEKIKQMRPQFKATIKANYDIDIQQGQFGINSRPALIGMKYAEHQGKGQVYHKHVFEAYFQDGLNIEDMNVLRNIVTEIGLDADEFEKALSNSELDAEVTADVQTAANYSITGVPATLFVDKYLLSGAQPYDELVRIIDQIKQRDNIT
jgi:predicted DsbA family dithiol-disulfide isomerase